MLGLGAEYVAKSDQSTGNSLFASYVLQSGQVRFAFTAPYSNQLKNITNDSQFNSSYANDFIRNHGLAVRAVAIEVEDVYKSYETIISNGGISALEPRRIIDSNNRGHYDIAEIKLYGDVVLRLISLSYFGIRSFDHIVGNLWSIQPTMAYLQNITGFHEFAEFIAEDVGTVDSGLNSVVLANNKENILLPLNEPTFGTKRKSQIQTYLEQNLGEGVQHIALQSSDIFYTLKCMKLVSYIGGFEFMDPPNSNYYMAVRKKLGDNLTESQYQLLQEYGILADRDTEGILLQIFTKPIGDRPTIFLEIIQRIGCIDKNTLEQRPGCGGFGKGNFKDLFKSIEDYEKKLNI
eukprot:gene17833-23445_t